MDKGRNSGTNGVVDIVGNGTNATFGMRVLFYKESSAMTSVDNTGEGDNDQSAALSLIEHGSILMQGQIPRHIFPSPDALRDAHGQITLYLDKPLAPTGQAVLKLTATYRFTKVTMDYDDPKETTWQGTIAGDREGANAFTGWNNNASNPTFIANPSGNKYLYANRIKVVDENGGAGIVDYSNREYNVWGVVADNDATELTAVAWLIALYATPPQAGEKPYTATARRLSSKVVKVSIAWRPSNSKDILELGGTSSSRSNFQPFVDVISSKVDSSSSAQTIANSLYSGFFQTVGPPYPYRLRVNKVNPNVARVMRTWLDPGILVFSGISSHQRWVPARLSGSTVQVWIAQKWTVSTGLYKYRVCRTLISTPVRLFTLRRMWSQTPPAPDFFAQVNTTNNNTFLGLSAGTVYYRGDKLSTNISNTGILPFFTDYFFNDDPNGVFDFSGFQEGIFYSTANLTAATWAAASALVGVGIVGTVPAQSNFANFLA